MAKEEEQALQASLGTSKESNEQVQAQVLQLQEELTRSQAATAAAATEAAADGGEAIAAAVAAARAETETATNLKAAEVWQAKLDEVNANAETERAVLRTEFESTARTETEAAVASAVAAAVEAAQKEKDAMMAQLEDLQREQQKMRDELSAAASVDAQAQVEAQSATSEMTGSVNTKASAAVQEVLEEAQLRADDLEKSLNAAKSEHEALQESLQAELAAAKTRADDLEKSLAAAKDEEVALYESLSTLQESNDQAQGQVLQLQEKLATGPGSASATIDGERKEQDDPVTGASAAAFEQTEKEALAKALAELSALREEHDTHLTRANALAAEVRFFYYYHARCMHV